jgi:hypothetical protein
VLLSDFQDAVDDHGTDLADWPLALRDAAKVLLASSEEARQFLAEEIALDHALSAAMAPIKAPAGLADRIVLKAAGDDGMPARTHLRLVDTVLATALVSPVPAGPRQPAWRRAVNWLAEQIPNAGLRYGLAFALCFSVGLGASLLLARPNESNYSTYVSGLYADLAY